VLILYKVGIIKLEKTNNISPLISIRELLERADKLLIEGAFTLKVEANLVNETLDLGNIVVIDPCSSRKVLTSIPELSWQILGWNASISLRDLLKERFEDHYFMIPYLVEAFSDTFKLSPIESKVLTEAFVELVDSGSEYSFSDLANRVEEISSTLPYSDRVRVTRLINLLQMLNLGRVGAALSNDAPISNINRSVLFDVSLIPWKFKDLICILLLIWSILKSYKVLLLGGPLSDGVIESLKVVVDLMLSTNHESKLVVSGIAQSQVRKIVEKYPDFALLREMKVRRSTRWTYISGQETYEVAFEELPLETTYAVMPEQILKPIAKVRITLLEKIFKREVEMAYKALAFLREGATTRDGLVSYLTYAFSIKTNHALKLITKLIAYGLVEEVIGKDTKYWIRLTIRGYSALEEYEMLKSSKEGGEDEY